MPIRIIADGQYDKPVIYCDHCGELIENVEEGNYQYKSTATLEKGGASLFFTHRRCCAGFDRTEQGEGTGANELAFLLVYLTNSLKLDLDKERRRAGVLNRFELL